ncbi:MAG: helix-turn-helix domain-containing protein [Marinobacterium sp.]|nr:helix-turn-helix domain-containing protein [Marinobacterium sp.]
MLKATKVRIYPTAEQAEFLNRQFGAVRFTYNKALYIISSQYKRHGQKLRVRRDIKPLLAVAKIVPGVLLQYCCYAGATAYTGWQLLA